MTSLPKLRNLTLAASFALMAVSVPVLQAQAKPASGGANPTSCNVIENGHNVSYPIGTRYEDENGRRYVCGDDGWFHEVAAIVGAPINGTPVQAPGQSPVQPSGIDR